MLLKNSAHTVDANLQKHTGRAPQAHPHERHDRTAQPRDRAAHARRGKLPGRERRAHARPRAHQVRRRERMVQPALPRHVPAR